MCILLLLYSRCKEDIRTTQVLLLATYLDWRKMRPTRKNNVIVNAV